MTTLSKFFVSTRHIDKLPMKRCAKHVLTKLAFLMGKYPYLQICNATLAGLLFMHPTTVSKALAELAKEGYLFLDNPDNRHRKIYLSKKAKDLLHIPVNGNVGREPNLGINPSGYKTSRRAQAPARPEPAAPDPLASSQAARQAQTPGRRTSSFASKAKEKAKTEASQQPSSLRSPPPHVPPPPPQVDATPCSKKAIRSFWCDGLTVDDACRQLKTIFPDSNDHKELCEMLKHFDLRDVYYQAKANYQRQQNLRAKPISNPIRYLWGCLKTYATRYAACWGESKQA